MRSMKLMKIVMLVLILLVSACSPKESTSSDKNEQGETIGEAPYELVMAFPVFGPVPRDMQKIQDAINEISKEKINATVKFEPISIGAYSQQFNLMLTSNEKLDLLMVSFMNTDLVAKGSLNELDDLLEEHGHGIKEVFEPEYLEAAKINNKHYFIPNYNEMATHYGLIIPKKYVDEYGIDLTKVTSFSDLEYVFETIKTKNSSIAPLVPAGVGFSLLDHYSWFDSLGDSIGVLPGYDNDLQVVNLYETAEYKEHLQQLRKWYEAGYILKDAATNQDSQFDLIKSGRGVAMLNGLKPDSAEELSTTYGMEMVSVPLTEPYAATRNVVGLNWGIPINSEKPEKAMQFLDLLYSNKEIISLMHWGIEGEHYAKVSDNVIDYPEGVDGSSTGYGLGQNWMFGDQFGSGVVWNGTNPDVKQQYKEYNQNANLSKALGFSFNPEPIRNEYTAVNNVINQYKLSLETGSVDPETVLPEFISKLKDAGIDRIIEEKQNQLDAWASKK